MSEGAQSTQELTQPCARVQLYRERRGAECKDGSRTGTHGACKKPETRPGLSTLVGIMVMVPTMKTRLKMECRETRREMLHTVLKPENGQTDILLDAVTRNRST